MCPDGRWALIIFNSCNKNRIRSQQIREFYVILPNQLMSGWKGEEEMGWTCIKIILRDGSHLKGQYTCWKKISRMLKKKERLNPWLNQADPPIRRKRRINMFIGNCVWYFLCDSMAIDIDTRYLTKKFKLLVLFEKLFHNLLLI